MLPNIPEDGRSQVLGCAWHFVAMYGYNFATWRTNPCWLSVTLPSDYLQLPFPNLQLDMLCPTDGCWFLHRVLFCLAGQDFHEFIVRCSWWSHYHGTQCPREGYFFGTDALHMLWRCAAPTQFLLSVFCICLSLGTAHAVQHWLRISAAERLPPAKNWTSHLRDFCFIALIYLNRPFGPIYGTFSVGLSWC